MPVTITLPIDVAKRAIRGLNTMDDFIGDHFEVCEEPEYKRAVGRASKNARKVADLIFDEIVKAQGEWK